MAGSPINYKPLHFIALYKLAVKKIRGLEYSWGLIVAYCMLALAAYLKLGAGPTLLINSLWIIAGMFAIFIFSVMVSSKEKVFRIPVIGLVYSIYLVLICLVLGFGFYIFTPYKASIYDRLFRNSLSDKSISNKSVTPPGSASSNAPAYITELSISGQVQDDNGRPLKGVVLSITGISTTVITNAAGYFKFTFNTPPVGKEYTITFSKEGFETVVDTYFEVPKANIIKQLKPINAGS